MSRPNEGEPWSAREQHRGAVAAGRKPAPPRRPLWRIAEPTTTLTDVALAVLTAALGVALLVHGLGRGSGAVLLWAGGFLITAASALLGAVVHGFAPWLSLGKKSALWKATLVLIGLNNFFLLAAVTVAELRGGVRVALLGLAVAKLLAYLIRLRTRNDFSIAAVDAGVSLLAVLALQLFALVAGGAAGAGWIITGVLLSLAGAGLQRNGWGLHRHFNHNDLFHVVQMGAAYLLYRGGLLL